MVAPCAGAWIEIASFFDRSSRQVSLPVRERGLKLKKPLIETGWTRSLPVRERGLKLHVSMDYLVGNKSLPVRERGLKLNVGAEKRLFH